MLKNKSIRVTKTIALIALILGIAELALVLLSWGISAAIPDVSIRSLLSSEGIRWFFGNFTQNLATPVLVWLLLGSIAYGALLECGLATAFAHPNALTYREQFAFRVVYVVIGVIIVVLLLLTVVPHAALLSVTGSLFPSSFSDSIVAIVCFSISFVSVIYGVMSGRLRNLVETFNALTIGITYTLPLWLLYILAAELYFSIFFVFF
jgi:aminobenzoyl-glutamate transport protein